MGLKYNSPRKDNVEIPTVILKVHILRPSICTLRDFSAHTFLLRAQRSLYKDIHCSDVYTSARLETAKCLAEGDG